MYRGRKTKLTLTDLSSVPPSNRAVEARTPLIAQLDLLPIDTSARLLRATFNAYRSGILLPVLPRLVLLGATFAQPFLVEKLVSYVSDPTIGGSERGWYLVAGTVCIFGYVPSFRFQGFFACVLICLPVVSSLSRQPYIGRRFTL